MRIKSDRGRAFPYFSRRKGSSKEGGIDGRPGFGPGTCNSDADHGRAKRRIRAGAKISAISRRISQVGHVFGVKDRRGKCRRECEKKGPGLSNWIKMKVRERPFRKTSLAVKT